jgi:hypothetical protein
MKIIVGFRVKSFCILNSPWDYFVIYDHGNDIGAPGLPRADNAALAMTTTTYGNGYDHDTAMAKW